MYRYRLEYIKDEDMQNHLDENHEIMKAMKYRHVAEAKETMRAHIDNQALTVSKNIKEK